MSDPTGTRVAGESVKTPPPLAGGGRGEGAFEVPQRTHARPRPPISLPQGEGENLWPAKTTSQGHDPVTHKLPIGSDFDETPPIAKMTRSRPAMAQKARAAPGPSLFIEDFDQPPKRGAAPEPEIVESTFSQADLEAARQQGWQAGHDTAAAASAQADTAAIRTAIAAIATAMAQAHSEVAMIAQQAADELARLLFDSFAATFPALCAAYGETELRSLVRTIAPALRQEASVTVRVNPAHAGSIRQEVEQADPDLATRMQIVAAEIIPPGDIRVVWRSGQATRDAAALWRQVAEILAPAGLLSYAAAKEPERVE